VKRTVTPRDVATACVACLVLAGGTARGEVGSLSTGGASGGPYRIDAMTIDGGGGRSATSAFIIEGTAGQHDADPLHPSSGGSFSVVGGFWPAATAAGASDRLFADGFEAPDSSASASVQPAD
jgi:hypothetical protein